MSGTQSDQSFQLLELTTPELTRIQVGVKSDRSIRRALENLSITADQKAILNRLMSTTVQVGQALLQIGRAVVSFVMDLIKIAPTTTFGTILGLTLSTLVSSIPVLGLVLGPLLSPILIAFGVSVGAFADMKGGQVGEKLDEFVDRYRPLTANV